MCVRAYVCVCVRVLVHVGVCMCKYICIGSVSLSVIVLYKRGKSGEVFIYMLGKVGYVHYPHEVG